MSEVVVAATQMACDWDRAANIERAERLVRSAALQGAQIILLQELFETPYFCIDQSAQHFSLGHAGGGESRAVTFPKNCPANYKWCCRSVFLSAPIMPTTTPRR